MRRIGKQKAEEGAEIDLTPMLDVVFIMLIFFIVVASFLKEAGVEVTRPDNNQPDDPNDAVSIVFEVASLSKRKSFGKRRVILMIRCVLFDRRAKSLAWSGLPSWPR